MLRRQIGQYMQKLGSVPGWRGGCSGVLIGRRAGCCVLCQGRNCNDDISVSLGFNPLSYLQLATKIRKEFKKV